MSCFPKVSEGAGLSGKLRKWLTREPSAEPGDFTRFGAATRVDLDIIRNPREPRFERFFDLHRDVSDLHEVDGPCANVGILRVVPPTQEHLGQRLQTVLISTQHAPGIDREGLLTPDLLEHVIRPTLPAQFADDDFEVLCNPTGAFELGGPHADCGLTGRKIIVDTYGGMARHGGGAFSGKDPSKVDRSAAYAGRYVAKNIVAAGLADRCEIQVSYAIGVAEPTSIMIETFGTGKIADEKIVELVRKHFDLRPYGILKMMDLLNTDKIKYRKTAAYGHFGREDEGFTWELTDRADALREDAGL